MHPEELKPIEHPVNYCPQSCVNDPVFASTLIPFEDNVTAIDISSEFHFKLIILNKSEKKKNSSLHMCFVSCLINQVYGSHYDTVRYGYTSFCSEAQKYAI